MGCSDWGLSGVEIGSRDSVLSPLFFGVGQALGPAVGGYLADVTDLSWSLFFWQAEFFSRNVFLFLPQETIIFELMGGREERNNPLGLMSQFGCDIFLLFYLGLAGAGLT